LFLYVYIQLTQIMRFFPCLLLFFLVVNFSFSQVSKQIFFDKLSVEQGLSQNSVVGIAQDSTGYMWFATQDGLNKYDGRNFIYYDKQFEDVTKSDYSRLGKIYSDKEGNLWIIRNSGILELFDVKANDFKRREKLKNVSVVYQDNDYNLFFGKYKEGLIKVDAVSKDTIQVLKEENRQCTVYDILEHKNNTYVATSGAVFSIDKELKERIFSTKNTEVNYSSLAIREDIIWSGSYGHGLFFLNPKINELSKFKGFKSYHFPNDLNIEDLLVDNLNRIWVATYGKGLYLIDFNSKTIKNFIANKSNPYSIHYNDILSLYQDNTGTIWIGTDGAGLSYYDEHLYKFNLLTNNQIPDDASLDVVRAISVDKTGNIWIGTSGKGLTFINQEQNRYKTYTTKNSSISSNRVLSLLHNNNTLLIGQQEAGLDVLDSLGNFKKVKHLSGYTIWKIIKGNKNDFWLCTRNRGLLNLDSNLKIIKTYSTENSKLTTNNIRTLILDKQETIWVGTTDEGLFKLNQKSGKLIKIEQISYGIKSLYLNNDILWIGTNGQGLISYNTITREMGVYDKTKGLPNNVIYAILPDAQNNLWLSSNKGIIKFKLINNSKYPEIKTYTNYDGLQSLEFNTGAYFIDKGNLYLGGLNGINWFKPNQLTLNSIKPKTVISNLKISNKNIDIIQNRKYKNNENTVTFTFSGLHFSRPEQNQYQYKLENYDKEWNHSNNNNIAHYTNLPPNNYTFKVKSSNYDGIWNEIPTLYNFTILQPWYATFWAKIIYALLVFTIGFSIFKYFKWRWLIKTQLKLEQAEAKRLHKLDELKTKLYTNISHEFRTPLTLISGPVQKQLKRTHLKREDKEELELIKRSSDRLLSLVDQMLDLSMLDSGHVKLNFIQGNLGLLVEQLIVAFKYKAQEKHILIKSSIDKKLVDSWFDKDIIEKIVSNLLSNAIKYSTAGQDISVTVLKRENNFVFIIINKTTALKNENLSKLFERFYQSNTTFEGVGIGLALVKELVEFSKGTITADSFKDEIKFTVTLPIGGNHNLLKTNSKNEFEFPSTNINKVDGTDILLIVEDNTEMRNFISSIFKNSYKIIEANDGGKGIEKALKYIPDIIISDVMMPETTGIDLCNTLKNNELTSHIPIILLTAKSGDRHEIEGLKTGADTYVTKPFNIEKLTVEVVKLLRVRKLVQEHYSKTYTINPKISINSTEKEFISRLNKVLDTHITSPDFKTENFNEFMQMSRMQLHRKIKAQFGMTTSQFLRSKRLQLALPLLNESDLTISEIAYKVGFNSSSYFISSFKTVYKLSPKEYLQKQNKK